MNLTVNPAVSNNAKPNFGMAVKFHKNALPVIKREALKLGEEGYQQYWQGIEDVIARQADNPVNIIVKKITGRQALKAYVVDEAKETAVPNIKIKQGLFHKNGSLKFLDDAEVYADELRDVNGKIKQLDIAQKCDMKPAKTIIE